MYPVKLRMINRESASEGQTDGDRICFPKGTVLKVHPGPRGRPHQKTGHNNEDELYLHLLSERKRVSSQCEDIGSTYLLIQGRFRCMQNHKTLLKLTQNKNVLSTLVSTLCHGTPHPVPPKIQTPKGPERRHQYPRGRSTERNRGATGGHGHTDGQIKVSEEEGLHSNTDERYPVLGVRSKKNHPFQSDASRENGTPNKDQKDMSKSCLKQVGVCRTQHWTLICYRFS